MLSCKGCLLESVVSGCLWSAHFERITSSIGSPGLIQDVNYLYLLKGPSSLLARLAALLSASSLLLILLLFLRKLHSRPSYALSRGHSGVLSSRRHQCCLYGQAQELKLWSRVYSSISRSARANGLVGRAVRAKGNAATTELVK